MISRDSLKGITSVIAVGLAIFQIYFTAGFGIIDSQLLRTIHLGIVLALVFLYFPPKKLQEGEREHPGWLAADILAKGRRILALEAVQDPGNVGTLLRSAAAFGFDGVLLSKGCAAPFAPKTLRASMGAAGRLPVAPVQDLPQALQQLRARGVVCLAAALYHSRPLDEAPQSYPDGLCAVIGSEGQGLTDAAVQACDMAVRIPMTDLVESLNAGVAGSVLLWHFRGV